MKQLVEALFGVFLIAALAVSIIGGLYGVLRVLM
jgi:hypothetical protein